MYLSWEHTDRSPSATAAWANAPQPATAAAMGQVRGGWSGTCAERLLGWSASSSEAVYERATALAYVVGAGRCRGRPSLVRRVEP
jgi:hypothetical protein